MTNPVFDRTRLALLLELAVVLLLTHYFSPLVVGAAALAHVELPLMPLFRHTYIFFLGIVLLGVWLRLRGEALSQFGLAVPPRWLRAIGQGVLIFLAAMVWDMVGRPLLDPFVAHQTGTSAHLAEQTFAAMRGNAGLLALAIPCGWIFGGLGEEFLFRGFIMTRFAQLLGGGRGAWIAAVVLQAIPFALGHSYQGPVGVAAIFVGSMITGAGFYLCGRNLVPVIIAHGLQDTLGFVALYGGFAGS